MQVQQQQPDNKPGLYFVSAIKGEKWVPLVGPFKNDHAAALAMVDKAMDAAHKVDPQAPWYSYGTMRADFDAPEAKLVGKLNAAVGFVQ